MFIPTVGPACTIGTVRPIDGVWDFGLGDDCVWSSDSVWSLDLGLDGCICGLGLELRDDRV
jgi:hypothetical protein